MLVGWIGDCGMASSGRLDVRGMNEGRGCGTVGVLSGWDDWGRKDSPFESCLRQQARRRRRRWFRDLQLG